MKIINAIADQSIATLPAGEWHVHSEFEHTFNLSNKDDLRLILMLANQDKNLPGGIILPKGDFGELKKQLPDIKQIVLTSHGINIQTKWDYWHIIFANEFQTKLILQPLQKNRITQFLKVSQKVNFQTGFDYPFKRFLTADSSPFTDQIQGLMNSDALNESLNFFIGRGRGLTPAGDDFILGWSLIEQLTKENDQLKATVEQKINSNEFTTDISRSYLSWMRQGYFSRALLDIVDYLSGKWSDDRIERLLNNATNYGNTSGIDTIAGITSALIFKQLDQP